MRTKKPIKVNNGGFITGSDFETLYFTEKQALAFAKKGTRAQEKGFTNGWRFKNTSIKDCGEYWTISRS